MHHRKVGLKAWQKLAGQILCAVIFQFAYFHEGLYQLLWVPVLGNVNATVFYELFVFFVLVCFSNAVNQSDG